MQSRCVTEGASVMYLSVDGQLAGLLAVSDPIKAHDGRSAGATSSRSAFGWSWPPATA